MQLHCNLLTMHVIIMQFGYNVGNVTDSKFSPTAL